MNPSKTAHPTLLAGAVALVTAILGFSPASAQTPPTPTHTFNATTNNTFGTNTNWSLSTLPVAGSQVLIADGKTATTSQTDANTLFGSLTLGVGSIINLAASSNSGLASGQDIYFSNNSQLNLTSGTINRSADYILLPGATAQMSIGSNTIPSGTVTGDATTTLNYNVTGIIHSRLTNSAFAGVTNYNASSGSHLVNITQHGTAPIVGPGTTNFANNVRSVLQASNRIHDSGTIKLTGSSGGASNVKFDMGGNSDTIGNFAIDSPTGATASAPTVRGSSALTVTGTTTFQGTAGNVNIDSNLAALTNNLLTTGNMTFGGTGTWAVSGDGRIHLNAASGTRTITTNADASIANLLVGTQGFTKAGAGILTLTGNLTNLSGNFTVSAGQLFLDGATGLGTNTVAVTGNGQLRSNVTIPGVSVSTGATLNIGTATGVETLTTDAFSLASTGTGISFQYSANDVNDQIVAPTLDLTGVDVGGITINGTNLAGYEAQIGDVFTLFSGTVTGFDASKFILNMPTLTNGGSWGIQEGSLQLVVIPEPSGILLSGIALMGLILRRRR